MPVAAPVPVEEYLSSSYEPDCEYINGELGWRNVGEISREDKAMALSEKIDDYTVMGVNNIWIVEPRLQRLTDIPDMEEH